MDNEGFDETTTPDEDETETSFSVCSSSQVNDSTVTQDAKAVDDNGPNNENVSVHDGDNGLTGTSVGVATASSRCDEVDPTQAEDDATEARGCYVPLCGVVFCVAASLGFLCMYALRVSVSVAVVAMVNYTALADAASNSSTNVSGGTEQCRRDDEALPPRADGEFTWGRYQQTAALATYFYGYTVIQVREREKFICQLKQ